MIDNRAGWWSDAACSTADPELFFPSPCWARPSGKWSRPKRYALAAMAAISTALLMAPVAYHRLVFRRRQKEVLVKGANIMTLCGLAAVGLAISGAVLLVVSYVVNGTPAVIIAVFVGCFFAGLWFVLPLARRRSRFPAVNCGKPD